MTLLAIGVGGATAESRASKLGADEARQAYFEHGQLHWPARIAGTIGRLNDALDSCYLAHGAKHVPFENGGFSYSDPTGSAKAACALEQGAVNDYAESDEMKGFSRGVQPLEDTFWGCLSKAGVAAQQGGTGTAPDTRSATFVAAADSCSAEADRAFGSSPGS